MAKFMQVAICFPSRVKYLKSIFLNIYNCAWKPGFLKSSHIAIRGSFDSDFNLVV